MATFYKYAERNAESQVNWAEIGKNMTDMLRDEVALREEKKAAIDEATRKLAEQVSNAPQGESESARAEAIRYADQVTQYMQMQERLLKGGLLNPKDYMVARQNLTDGTRQAFGVMKRFQEEYGKLMEGVRKGTTSIISVKELEKIQGYGNFRQSGFFIDAPTGKVNVGLKEYQDIDGQKVVGLKNGSSVGMQYIEGGIYGIRDVYDYRTDIMNLSNSLGEEIRVTLDPGTMSTLGSAKTLSDLRQRVVKIATEDPTREKELFNFYDSMEKALGGYLVNENNLGSLLADTMGYEWTDNPEEAKKNPNTVLGGVDPNTGQPSLEFTDKNKQDAADFMMQQFLGTIKVEEKVQGMGQPQLQERRPRTEAEMGRADKIKDAENFGRQLGTALKSDDDQEVGNSIIYLAQKAKKRVNRNGSTITVSEMDGTGESTFDLNDDPDKIASAMISAFGTDLPEDTILKFTKSTYKGNKANTRTVATGFTEEAEEQAPLDELKTIVSESVQNPNLDKYINYSKTSDVLAQQFNKYIASKLSGVKFDYNPATGNVFVDVNGVESEGYQVGDATKNKAALKNMQDFIVKTYAKGGTAEEQEMAAEAALSLFPKTSRKTGGVMAGY